MKNLSIHSGLNVDRPLNSKHIESTCLDKKERSFCLLIKISLQCFYWKLQYPSFHPVNTFRSINAELSTEKSYNYWGNSHITSNFSWQESRRVVWEPKTESTHNVPENPHSLSKRLPQLSVSQPFTLMNQKYTPSNSCPLRVTKITSPSEASR